MEFKQKKEARMLERKPKFCVHGQTVFHGFVHSFHPRERKKCVAFVAFIPRVEFMNQGPML
jgi:hypothetical protein